MSVIEIGISPISFFFPSDEGNRLLDLEIVIDIVYYLIDWLEDNADEISRVSI
jgi:hypothetical protein